MGMEMETTMGMEATIQENVARAYIAGPGEKKEYAGTLPLCNKCKYHHNGPCTAKCSKCKRIGHQTKDCRRHYRSECPELKNRNRGNKAGSSEAHGKVYALGGGETDQDLTTLQMISMLKERFFSSCLVKPKLEPY
ncbi:reverse transcriptase domain-containing protein [Tanacetum coccineum]